MIGIITKIQLSPEKINSKGERTKEAVFNLSLEFPVDTPENRAAILDLQNLIIHNDYCDVNIESKQLRMDLKKEEERVESGEILSEFEPGAVARKSV